MRDSVRSAFPGRVQKYEGRTSWMYLDTKGLVTTGVGNLIDPVSLATPLPWLLPGGDPATEEQICSQWSAVKAMAPGMVAAKYRAADSLYLADEAIDDLVRSKLAAFWSILAGQFPDAEEWPAPAQLGLLLMAWALGPHFPARWPLFRGACERQDFVSAAAQCEISGARPARNAEHRGLFLAAAVADDMDALEST